MREVRQIVVTIALATAAAMFSSGCPAMMVPGLAYSGYKYAHDKNNPQTASNTQSGKSATTSSSTHNAKSTTTASESSTHSKSATTEQQKIPDSEIE